MYDLYVDLIFLIISEFGYYSPKITIGKVGLINSNFPPVHLFPGVHFENNQSNWPMISEVFDSFAKPFLKYQFSKLNFFF